VVELPEGIGVPVAVIQLELPSGALADKETASFDIQFEINVRGVVVQSKIQASSRPDLAARILEQHRQWIYSVASRATPCRAVAFRGIQHIEVARSDGKLSMTLEAARVEEEIAVLSAIELHPTSGADKPALRLKASSRVIPKYPLKAIIDGVEGTIGVIFEFGPDGKARDPLIVNGGTDRWGLTDAALQMVSRYELEEPPGRTVVACQTVDFKIQ
jgi:hypothetical protein